MSAELSISCYSGPDALAHISQVASLHVEIFREFPYLYDRDVKFEEHLLAMSFTNADAPFFALVYDGNKLVGASTSRSLCNRITTNSVEYLFRSHDYDPTRFYYLADSVLFAHYRGRGIGRAFFALRERHATEQGFSSCCFCAVQRPVDHPLRPDNYRPLNTFWEALGYKEKFELETAFSWKDIDQSQATAKKMRYWTKNLGSTVPLL